ncbi:MAG: hypothetical protein JEZ09_03560 [Salinivirgaceae bacterium]|nr:hypothetical protein [Salinivirgaceae bacterium]
MRKFTLIVALSVLFVAGTNAQEIGVRFGNVTGGNVALDGVFSTGDFGRIHADVSFGNGIGVDLLWDFLYKPLGSEALNWYTGVGPYAFIGDPFSLGVVGELGIEYRFKEVPISLSADWRPYFRLVDNTDFGADSFGLNVRWIF